MRSPRLLAALLAALCVSGGLAALPSASAAPAAAADVAFDPGTGALDVDYAHYLSRHDIVYNEPETDPGRGLTVGNGRVGAMAWAQNGLSLQVSGVDASEQSVFGAGDLGLATTPAMDSGYRTYQQRLSLYDGTLTTKYDGDRTVTVMGEAGSEVMGIHVEDARTDVSAVTLDLGLWDVSKLANSGDVPDLDTWKTVSAYADADSAGISRGQADPNGFGYTLAATVEGAPFTAKVVDGRTVRLTITPSSSYTVWFTSSSRLDAPGHDSLTQAKKALGSVRSAGYAKALAGYLDWWHAFWQKSFVQYANASGDADYLENVYYLATYLIAAGGQGNYPFHFINGVFRATGDDTKWSNAYWYWNQRDVYHSFLASGHADMTATFNNLYSRNAAALKAYTRTRYGVEGLWVPETMGWDGNARGTVNSDYTKNILSTGTEAAESMYAQYQYTDDTAYLRDTAYPFMRDVAVFYTKMLSKDASGTYYMANSNAHETYWNVRNAITDLAAVRSLFPAAVAAARRLGRDADLAARWQDVLDHLVAYPSDTAKDTYLPHTPPLAQTRNDENVASELVWPYGVTGIGYPDRPKAVDTWNARPFPYDNVWANDAIQAARLGLGDQAYDGMKKMLQKYQNFPNGLTANTNGVFEYLGVNLSAMNESLLQSYNGKIRVFPAIPSDPSFTGRFTLRASGGFTVSAERAAGETAYVGIRSLYGNSTTVVNPWGTQQVRVRRLSDNAVLQTTSAAEFTLDTAKDTGYVVERTAKPLGDYGHTTLTGTANQGVKTLGGTASSLGVGAAPAPAAAARRAAR
ncbi:glycoside hydrolase family 95-like protein [Streptomyces sp. NPDC047002]|uniref:glycosyl hydrolase family 95 catalytic domain-containing protein n=1 Tax=Streptomyces sp. NPDC047002 TaxID=3155475 RepID=UPI0034518617